MNGDVLLEILNQIDFNDMVGFADVDKQFQELIGRHILIPKLKINEKTIEFSHGISGKPGTYSIEKEIKIKDVKIFLIFLRNSGHLITKLSYHEGNLNKSAKKLIGESINKYCRKSLNEISAMRFDAYMTNEWKQPFENVEKVLLGYGELSDQTTSQLNRLFPKMLELTIYSRFHSKAFHSLNETLSNLERVLFYHSDTNRFEDYDVKHFSNVKELAIVPIGNGLLPSNFTEHFPFVFPKLEEFLINSDNQWAEVVTRMISLKSIELRTPGINIQQWLRMTGKLTNLVDVSLQLHIFKNVIPNSMIESIDNHQSLQRIIFQYMEDLHRQDLSDRIKQNWKWIRDHDKTHEALFVRVNNTEDFENMENSSELM